MNGAIESHLHWPGGVCRVEVGDGRRPNRAYMLCWSMGGRVNFDLQAGSGHRTYYKGRGRRGEEVRNHAGFAVSTVVLA